MKKRHHMYLLLSIVIISAGNGLHLFMPKTDWQILIIIDGFCLALIMIMYRWVRDLHEQIAGWKATQKKWDVLLKMIPIVTWSYNAERKKIMHVSSGVQTLLGYASEDFITKRSLRKKVIHRDDRKKVWKRAKRLARGSPVQQEYRVVQKDGSIKWVNEYIHPEKNQKGKVTRITGVVTDITRLKKLESQLLQSLKETDLIINSVQDIIYVIDLKGRLIGWNKRLEEWSGYDKKDLRKKTIFRFFVKQDRQEIEKAFQQVLHHGKVQVEGRIVNQKGEQRLFDWSGVLLKDEEGRSIGITGVGKDISHQEEVRRHLYLAGKVQYGMLPPEINNSDVEIKTFYSPKSVVSGDFFNYEWNKERNRLTGYMIDVMGHGLEASLHTSALHVLFNQLNDEDIPLHEKLHWINRESKHYFHEEYFATAFCFEFDMTKRMLHYVSGGINHFLRRTDEGWQEIKVPGSFIGVFEDATFENHRLSFAGGDSFLFFSDGLKPYLNDMNNNKTRSFHDTMQLIERLPNSSDQEDDISVIGIRFK